jgi:hypothetical protein
MRGRGVFLNASRITRYVSRTATSSPLAHHADPSMDRGILVTTIGAKNENAISVFLRHGRRPLAPILSFPRSRRGRDLSMIDNAAVKSQVLL